MTWCILNNELVNKLSNNKILAVAEVKTLLLKSWKGELGNDFYFFITFMGGVLYLATGEREMLLPTQLKIIAHDSRIKNLMGKQPTEIQRAVYKNPGIHFQILNEMTFSDVMRLLKWEYASEKVDVFEVFWD